MQQAQQITSGVVVLFFSALFAALANAQDYTPWAPADAHRPPVATGLPALTGGYAMPAAPAAPATTARPDSWPGGLTPQPPGDVPIQRPPVAAAAAVPPADELPPVYYPPGRAPPTEPVPAEPRPVEPPPRYQSPAYQPPVYQPPAHQPPVYQPPAYQPPGTLPSAVYPPPMDAPAHATSPSAYPPAGSSGLSLAAPLSPAAAAPHYPPAGAGAYPVATPAAPEARVAHLPHHGAASPAAIAFPAPEAAMPLTPCEGALMVAAVGAEAVLASDLLSSAEENMERVMKDQFEKQRKKLAEAGREEEIEHLARQLDIEKGRWMEQVRSAINEASEGTINVDRMTPDQQSRRKLLENMLSEQIKMKLAYYDAKRKIPQENMPGVEKQLSKAFEQEYVPNLLKEYNVESWRDLDYQLRQRGSSLEREKRIFIERALSHQWIRQQVNPDGEVSYEQMVNYYRDHPTDFDKPANTRWQLLSVSLTRCPSRQEAYARIAAMGNRIVAGEDFAKVARDGSDGGGGSDGKLRDWPDENVHLPEVVQKAIDGLPPGQMSAILEDWRGYYIVRVVDRTPAHRQSFEVAQSEVREKIKQKRNDEQMAKYLADLRAQIPVWTILDATETAAKPLSGLRY